MSFKKISGSFIAILVACVFILSAYGKLFPIEPFEYQIVEPGFIGWKTSVFVSRLLIGFEFFLGILLLFNISLKKFTLPTVGLMLILFNIYLGIQLITNGNTGDCGCFGSLLSLSPLQGFIKNFVLLFLLIVPYKNSYNPDLKKYKKIVIILLALVSIALPFILNPVDLKTSERHYSKDNNYPMQLDLLYNDPVNAIPKVDLTKGKWVIAYMSLTCKHCRIAAKKLYLLKRRNPALNIHLVLNGKEEKLNEFFDDTRARNLSWSMFKGPKKFTSLAGPQLPSIFWVNNGMVENKTSYLNLEEEQLMDWLKNP